MPIRSVNDTISNNITILPILASVMTANTQFAASGGTLLYQNYDSLERGDIIYPVLAFEIMSTVTRRVHFRAWSKTLSIRADYIDRWDTQSSTINDIWLAMDLDMRLMQANIEDNPVLLSGGVYYASRITDIEIQRMGANKEDRTPVQTVKSRITMTVTTPIYISAL